MVRPRLCDLVTYEAPEISMLAKGREFTWLCQVDTSGMDPEFP